MGVDPMVSRHEIGIPTNYHQGWAAVPYDLCVGAIVAEPLSTSIRGLLHDYEPSCGTSFEALWSTVLQLVLVVAICHIYL